MPLFARSGSRRRSTSGSEPSSARRRPSRRRRHSSSRSARRSRSIPSWRHLDEARAALGQRGIAVEAYDALRATERPGQLAVDNIEHAEGIDPLALAFGGLQYVETKTATFNREGQVKARQACEAWMQAMPEVDWRALAQAEDAQIAAIGSLNAGKWRQLAIAGAVAIAAYVVFKLFG